jgi:hypothetical protein
MVSSPTGAEPIVPEVTVEALQEQLAELVAQRQALRAGGASGAELERNRRRILRAQARLSHALIARHMTAPQRAR